MLTKYLRLAVPAFATPVLLVSACAATARPVATTSLTPAPASVARGSATATPVAVGSASPAPSPVESVTASSTPTPAVVGDVDAIRACSLQVTTAAKQDPSGPPSTVRAGYDTTLGTYHQFLSSIGVADGGQANQAWATDTDATPVVECVWDGPFIGPGDPGTYSRAIGIVTPAGAPIPGSAAAYGTSSDVDRGWLARP